VDCHNVPTFVFASSLGQTSSAGNRAPSGLAHPHTLKRPCGSSGRIRPCKTLQ
jgi:hypothetical protein